MFIGTGVILQPVIIEKMNKITYFIMFKYDKNELNPFPRSQPIIVYYYMRYFTTTRCSECGRFLKLDAQTISYVLFGSCVDLEPPDPEYVHFKCWEKLSSSSKELTKRVSWIKPYQLGSVFAKQEPIKI